MRRFVVLIFSLPVLLLLAFLAGCSGGSSGSSSTNNNPGVTAPAITSISPASVNAGAAAVNITVTGTGFVSGSVVAFGGTPLQTTYSGSTSLQAAVPSALLANGQTAQVTVTNASSGGGTSTAISFAVNAPTPQVSSITPNTLLQASTGTLLVSGSGFEANSSVLWNGSARATTFVNATTLQAFVGSADTANPGTAQVTVNNPGPGGSTTPPASEVIYSSPAIASLSPATIPSGSAVTQLTVTGTNFVSGSAIVLDGTPLATTYVSATTLQATLQASLLANARTASVTVHNPAPTAADSAAALLAITSPPATLTNISPRAVGTGAAGLITLTGTGFSASTTALWNGSPRTTTFVNAITLRMALTASDLAVAGTGEIGVSNPGQGGGNGSTQTLTIVNLPVISSLNPSTVQETIYTSTTPTPITINGSSFATNATATVNGYSVTITSQSATQITGTIPVAATSSRTGAAPVYVFTPAAGGISIVSQPATLNIINAGASFQVNPAGVAAGSPDTKITLSGAGYFRDSVVQWNGVPLTTTYVTTSTLTAIVPASYLAIPGSAALNVNTPENLGQPGATSLFLTYPSLPVNGLAWNAVEGLIYATVPSSAGSPYGNSLAAIDPATGLVKKFVFVGSEPNRLALSTDATQAFVGLDGAAAVRQVDLGTMTAGVQFGLGGGPGVYNPPYTASSLAAVPGQPNSVAVYGTNGVVTIFDSGVARTRASGGSQSYFTSNSGALSFGASASTLYLSSQSAGYLYALTVDGTGVTGSTQLSTSGTGRTLQYDNGRLYFSNGTVAAASTGRSIGQLSVPGSSPATSANGPVVSESGLNRAWMVEGSYTSPNTIVAYDETTFNPVATLPFTSTATFSSNNSDLIRWGQNGLAFHIGTQLYIIEGPIVKDLSATPVDVKVTASAPASVTAGTSFATQFQVTNAGPNSAQGVSFGATLPAQLIYGSVTSPAGSCSGGTTVYCDLGTLASGASATITVNAVPSSTGAVQITGAAATLSFDSDGTNNQATVSTTAAGGQFSPVPAITAVSPNIVAAGSSTFVLTVTGTGFSQISSINWNGSPLTTTFVSSTSLTASVDSSLVTQLGWAAITVSSAGPGGGVSGTRGFSIYSLLDVAANAMVYDPYTRKLWAVLPSTSTTPAGNSIVPVDPSTATTGTPIQIGSEPNLVAETTSGNYIYVGLSGSKSMGRFNMRTQALDLTVPLISPSTYSPAPVAASQVATLPGLDNSVAVSNVGIFDISGSTATLRPNSVLGYNDAVFPDSAHAYAYDDYSTGAEFYRYTVDSLGVHSVDGTTLDGMGGFSGSFALDGGLGYGAAGGIFNPTTTVPQMVGTLPLGQGPYGTGLEGGGVVPYAAEKKAFVTGINTAGTWEVFLERFDTSHFLYEDAIQFPTTGIVEQTPGMRWSQDGLAFILNSGQGGTAPSQIMLLRGPFVLPSELASNSAPTLISVGTGPVAVGSGNQNVTVKGTGFLPGASVVWNGAVHDTTYVDASTLSVAVGAGEVNAAATVQVTCRNPGSSDSNAISMNIQ